jgi:hypothetical protein
VILRERKRKRRGRGRRAAVRTMCDDDDGSIQSSRGRKAGERTGDGQRMQSSAGQTQRGSFFSALAMMARTFGLLPLLPPLRPVLLAENRAKPRDPRARHQNTGNRFRRTHIRATTTAQFRDSRFVTSSLAVLVLETCVDTTVIVHGLTVPRQSGRWYMSNAPPLFTRMRAGH